MTDKLYEGICVGGGPYDGQHHTRKHQSWLFTQVVGFEPDEDDPYERRYLTKVYEYRHDGKNWVFEPDEA